MDTVVATHNQAEKGREQWIDCAKAAAIAAVVVDHCNGLLYTNQDIAKTSYFSVTLFILLSGITTYKSYTRKRQMYAGGGTFGNWYRCLDNTPWQPSCCKFFTHAFLT